MRRVVSKNRILLNVSVAFCMCQNFAAANVVLSGLVIHNADSTGSYQVTTARWNTLGDSPTHTANAYLIQGTNLVSGTFINSGNDANTSISISLNLGANTFSFMTDGGSFDTGFTTANFFFESDDHNPGITAVAANQIDGNVPTFTSSSSSFTYDMNADQTAGAGTLLYSDGTYAVTLTAYRRALESFASLDRVSTFNNAGANGTLDYTGDFTLTVSAVPEASAVAMFMFLISGSVAVDVARRHWQANLRQSRR